MASTPTLIQTAKLGASQILPADTTTKKTVVTAGASASKVVGFGVASTDSAARIAQLWMLRGGVLYLVNTKSITALAGNDGTVAPVDLLDNIPWLPIDNDGQKYLLVESGDVLQWNATTTVTAAKELDALAVFGNF